MLKLKTEKTLTIQCCLKIVIAAALLINLLIFAQLLMPNTAGNSKQVIGNREVWNEPSTFRVVIPAVNFIPLIIELYPNKPAL